MPAPQHNSPQPRAYPEEKARQGEIILKTRLQKAVFIAGLAGVVLLALAMPLMR